jgi:DNA mismatch repair protein MutS2
VELALAAAQGAVDDERAREARRVLEDEIRAQGAALAADEDSSAVPVGHDGAPLAEGDYAVTLRGLRGRVLELRPDGKAVLSAGAMRMVVPLAELAKAGGRPAEPASRRSHDLPDLAAPMEIDLRGMTGDEAEAATLAALDAAVLAEHPRLRIIHGMGTGVVRDRVRRMVRRDRRIRGAAYAPRNEGGTGVTIVEFED